MSGEDVVLLVILAILLTLVIAGIAAFLLSCNRIYQEQERDFAYYRRERARYAKEQAEREARKAQADD